MLLGGRTAEELIFADPTTGAQNDIDRATTIARQMVTEFGMSDELGPMRFGHPQGEVFLGRDFTSTPDYSERGRGEHRRRGAASHRRARHAVALEVLSENRGILDRLADELIQHETLEAGRVQSIFADVSHVGCSTTSGTATRGSRRPDASSPAPNRRTAAAATQAEPPHRGGPS